MGTNARVTICGLALAFVLPAQQGERVVVARASTSVMQSPDLSRHDEGAPPDRPKALTRLLEVLRKTPMGDSPARSMTLSEGSSRTGPVVLARGTKEQIEVVKASLEQLERSDPGSSRLHFSVVTMPLAVATAHKLEPGRTVVTDEATWTELLRDAVKAKGCVHNLPEVIAGFLAPFEREPATAKNAPDTDLPRLHGELVPLGNGEIAVALEVARKSKKGNQPTTLARPVFRLAAGKAAMMAAVDGDRVVVVIARCLETGIPTK